MCITAVYFVEEKCRMKYLNSSFKNYLPYMKKIHNLRIITSEPSKLNVSYGCRICLLMLVKGLLIINQLLHDNIKLLPELLF